jgi:hypothetical protein
MGRFSLDRPIPLRLATRMDASQRELRAGASLTLRNGHLDEQTAPRSDLA